MAVLTALSVERAKPDATKRLEIPDGGLRGLYLVVQPAGGKSWAVRYRIDGKPKKLTLGPFPRLPLGEAREAARGALRAVSEGRDPASERQAVRAEAAAVETMRFADVAADFVERHAKVRNRSWRETEAFLTRTLDATDKWQTRDIRGIGRKDVLDALNAVVARGASIHANRLFAALRRFFAWTVERGILETSPMAGLRPPSPEVSRDRVRRDVGRIRGDVGPGLRCHCGRRCSANRTVDRAAGAAVEIHAPGCLQQPEGHRRHCRPVLEHLTMTAINALVRADRVHLWTDGAMWLPDGQITGTTSKVHIFAQANAVLAARGDLALITPMAILLNIAMLGGLDDLLQKIPDAAATAASSVKDSPAEIVVAGWSHERGRGEIWKGDTSRANWRMEPQGDGFMMPGENPALMTRLAAAGWNLHDERKDEDALLELMEHQRAVDDHLPNGARFPTVGGFAQATVITADGISTRVVRRWPTRQAA